MHGLSRDYRGFTDGGIVHYVWQDEFLDWSTDCWTPGTHYQTYAVELSAASVNCITCIAINNKEQ